MDGWMYCDQRKEQMGRWMGGQMINRWMNKEMDKWMTDVGWMGR